MLRFNVLRKIGPWKASESIRSMAFSSSDRSSSEIRSKKAFSSTRSIRLRASFRTWRLGNAPNELDGTASMRLSDKSNFNSALELSKDRAWTEVMVLCDRSSSLSDGKLRTEKRDKSSIRLCFKSRICTPSRLMPSVLKWVMSLLDRFKYLHSWKENEYPIKWNEIRKSAEINQKL